MIVRSLAERGRAGEAAYDFLGSPGPARFPCIARLAGALFSSLQNSKFFHSLSITLIFNRLYGALNVGKKNK